VIFSDLEKTFRSRYSEKTCIHPAWKSARVHRGKGRSPDLDVKCLQRSVDPGRTLQPLVKVRTSPFNCPTRFRRIETIAFRVTASLAVLKCNARRYCCSDDRQPQGGNIAKFSDNVAVNKSCYLWIWRSDCVFSTWNL